MGLAYEQPVTVLTSFPEKTFVKLSLGYLNVGHVSTVMTGRTPIEPIRPTLHIFTIASDKVDLILVDPADIAIVTKALDARCQD